MHALIRWPNSVFAYPFVDAIQCTQKDCKNKCGNNIQQSFYLLNGYAICAFSQQCVVPENIYTLPTLEGHGNSEGLGGGGSERGTFLKGRDVRKEFSTHYLFGDT